MILLINSINGHRGGIGRRTDIGRTRTLSGTCKVQILTGVLDQVLVTLRQITNMLTLILLASGAFTAQW